MRNFITLGFILLLAAGSSGCLVSGQVVVVEPIDIGATTDQQISKYTVDLSTNEDWLDNKDDIVSIDAVELVAKITNNLQTDAIGEVWWSNNANLGDAADIRANATKFFTSPNLPGDQMTLVDWPDAFNYVENEDLVIAEILGDGIFTLYAIGKGEPFDLDVLGEVVLTITVQK